MLVFRERALQVSFGKTVIIICSGYNAHPECESIQQETKVSSTLRTSWTVHELYTLY